MCQCRVLLARGEGEVRQVQFCKWITTIEGSLEPLCRLTHSIIQARRCRRVTMRSRSLVSTSGSALASCLGVKGEGETHVERCAELQLCTRGHSNGSFKSCGSAESPCPPQPGRPPPLHRYALLRFIRVAEVPVRAALHRPVAHLLCNRQGNARGTRRPC
jgi:hypothetical protein